MKKLIHAWNKASLIKRILIGMLMSLLQNTKISRAWWHTPIMPAT